MKIRSQKEREQAHLAARLMEETDGSCQRSEVRGGHWPAPGRGTADTLQQISNFVPWRTGLPAQCVSKGLQGRCLLYHTRPGARTRTKPTTKLAVPVDESMIHYWTTSVRSADRRRLRGNAMRASLRRPCDLFRVL